MARGVNRLSARTVASLAAAGYHADGAGLYLQIGAAGTKSWIFRFTLDGRAREMGLGPLHTVPLAAARVKAHGCRTLLQDGANPIEGRRTQRAASRLAAAIPMTFGDCASAYIEAHRSGWRNAKHADQWRGTLRTYAEPALGNLPVQNIDTALVMRVLEPIWQTKTETASRLRGRMAAVLDWAAVRDLRRGENPARWRGHLDHLLPPPAKVQKVVHHPALHYAHMADFMAALRVQDGIRARALEFQILTAGRTGEVTGARWDEFDLSRKVVDGTGF